MTGRDVTLLFAGADSPISDAIACIDRSGRISMALIVDENRRLLNTVTDGDVRRGLLAGYSLTDPVARLLERKSQTPHPAPTTAPAGSDDATLLQIMQDRGVRQLPLLNAEGRVVDIVILGDFLPQVVKPIRAMVMAGGQGMRLRPLTEDTPKPMLPVGGRPVMERIVQQLRDVGIRHIHIATNYQSEKIVEHFGSGESFGVNIDYVKEQSLLDIWRGEQLLQFQRMHLEGRREDNSSCRDCTALYRSPDNLDGLSSLEFQKRWDAALVVTGGPAA